MWNFLLFLSSHIDGLVPKLVLKYHVHVSEGGKMFGKPK